jgi:hypothetical protein
VRTETAEKQTEAATALGGVMSEAGELSPDHLRDSSVDRVPLVRLREGTVRGRLDADFTWRIVRAHIGEVRFCYNRGLTHDPSLAGFVELAFAIGGDGAVTTADVTHTTLPDDAVGRCIATAATRWKFPRPTDRHEVEVVIGFELELGPVRRPTR